MNTESLISLLTAAYLLILIGVIARRRGVSVKAGPVMPGELTTVAPK